MLRIAAGSTSENSRNTWVRREPPGCNSYSKVERDCTAGPELYRSQPARAWAPKLKLLPAKLPLPSKLEIGPFAVVTFQQMNLVQLPVVRADGSLRADSGRARPHLCARRRRVAL